MVRTSPAGAVRAARRVPVLRVLARAGFAVAGLVHVVIGVLAVQLATGAFVRADPSEAFDQIASVPGGDIVLWVAAIGLAALGLWLVLGAFLLRPQDSTRRAARFIAEIGKGLAYLALAAIAFSFAVDTATSSPQGISWTANMLAHPGGVVAVIAVGILILGVGGYFLAKGVRRTFRRDIDVPDGRLGMIVVTLGVWGYLSKGVALAIVGVLFVVAGVATRPTAASGLDGALKALLVLPFGPTMVAIVGAGFVAYGVYCFVRARLARL